MNPMEDARGMSPEFLKQCLWRAPLLYAAFSGAMVALGPVVTAMPGLPWWLVFLFGPPGWILAFGRDGLFAYVIHTVVCLALFGTTAYAVYRIWEGALFLGMATVAAWSYFGSAMWLAYF